MNDVEKQMDKNDNIEVNDVLYTINKLLKYKNSDRKSYVRKKVKKRDMEDILTQLCFALYNAVENKTIVINDSQENHKLLRENIELRKEIDKLKENV